MLSRHGVTTASAVTRGHTETVQPLEPTYATWSSTCLPHQLTTCGNLCRHLTIKPTQSTIKCQNLGRTPAAHATAPKPHTSLEAARTSATSATTTSSLALSRLERPIGHRLQRLSQTHDTWAAPQRNNLKFAAVYDDADLQVRERIPLSYVRTPATSRYNV